jgi:glycerophosphoryl diester phosphodiesterase
LPKENGLQTLWRQDVDRPEEFVTVEDRTRILRIGHRGAAGHAPENTLGAIRAGISLGVDFIELDIQRTLDERLVVLHDQLVDRTTNGHGLVSSFTFAELQNLDAGNGEPIPSLEQALAAISGQAGAMLEAKSPGTGPAIYAAVQAAAFTGPVVYASFLHSEIRDIRRLDPQAQTLALIEGVPLSGAAFATEANATLVGLALDSATPEFVAILHRAGLEVWIYTVNDPALIAHTIALRADGIISDYPNRIPHTGTQILW